MKRCAFFLVIAMLAVSTRADQFKAFDGIEVHYVVVNTQFLRPEIASHYGIERGADRAIVNVSVVDHDGATLAAEIAGTMLDLLNHESSLAFVAVKDDQSIYYIAPIRYTDRDVLRFRIGVTLPDRAPMKFEFQQQMFVESEQ